MNKLIVILGPTASGKSSLAINLAKKFNGEIISADSRQVYKGLDIGSGKVTKKQQQNTPHHLLSIVSPKNQFSVDQFKKLAEKKISDIQKRGKLPFLVGGTAFYIYSVIDNLSLPEVKPNPKLRKQLENKSAAQLFSMLKKLDPARAKSIDPNNPHRLIRALEIIKATGKPVPILSREQNNNVLILGIKKEGKELRKAIAKRVKERVKKGLINEVRKLRKSGVTSKRLSQIGLTYAIANDFIDGKIDKKILVEKITTAEYQYAKRQMTWFKKDNRIHWLKNLREATKLLN